ncbi:uncharacterized protein [Elaeis guineensis]|uniref:uncharacterized protein isoform X2 n=1 Tax=Elaeis guineensis var. tenera TaxID=51953 RepID=UPI003C6D3417
MDNRDSSVAPAAVAAGKDGSAEEDGLLSVTAGLAKEAAVLFQSRRYSECIDVLKQLLQKKEDDPKILHNIAVAEYYHDGCPDPKKLLDVFKRVKRSEDLAHKSGEQMEAANSLGSNVTSGSRGSSGSLYQLSATNAGGIAYVDEFDTSIITFNTAVILYNLHNYANALSVLEPLYQNLEPIDESTALSVCLLLLDISLSSQDASKAADVIRYLEKSFGVSSFSNQCDNGSLQHQPLNQFKAAGTSNIAASDASSSDSSASANAAENSLVGNLSDEALEYETLYSTLDGGNQNLGRPTSNDHSKTSADWAATATDLKLKMHIYKVRLLLLTRNLKSAKRELKLAMNMVRGKDSSTELLLKSQLEYARGNHRKAIKLLDTISNRTEPVMLSMYNNNIGCILHQQMSHHTSNWFFNKALRHSLLLQSEKPLKLAAFSQDKSCLIAYNCGLQHLACGKPLAAARCFHQAIPVFSNRPLFWLRFAECCLLALEKGLLSASSSGENIEVHVAGSGKWRQLVVNYVNSRFSNSDSTTGDVVTNGDDQILISLPFARHCLLNAQLLLDTLDWKMTELDASALALEVADPNLGASINLKNSNQKNLPSGDSKALNSTSASTAVSLNCDPKETKGGTSSSTTLQISVARYEDVCRKENHRIRQAVLGDLAYVGLCLEDPLKALVAAKSLQHLPDCSKMHLFLGHVYAAEALCCLNRPKEAAEQLLVYIADGQNVELPYTNEDREKWSNEKAADYEESNGSLTAKTTVEGTKTTVEGSRDIMGFLKPDEARGALYVNLAAMSAIQGDLGQASHFAKQGLSSLPNSPRVLLAVVYVDLLQGKTQEALAKLRKCRRVRFLCSNVKMSS